MTSASTKKYTIIIVDDDLEVHNQILSFFVPLGYHIQCYTDAEKTLAESAIHGKNWDVLLTDFHFPNMTGSQFTLQIKKILPNLPIILIAPQESSEMAIDAIKQGAYDYTTKPIHLPQLQLAIERALHVSDLKDDNLKLREQIKTINLDKNKIFGRSPKFLAALDLAKRVAGSSASIFITGDSGTGKEVFAKFIHSESKFKKGPFVAINCSAIPESLLESELFGHAKGSFTGALDKKIGLFEEAQSGTLFLDEIGDLGFSLQAKLLRVLQEKKIRRVGENQYRPINCRIISATHKDLSVEVKENRFREDLYFRLNVIPIHLPLLRDRPEDIIPLAELFLKKYALENNSSAKIFSKEALRYILENPWRGNIRELENAIERAVVLCDKNEICLDNFLPTSNNLENSASNSNEDSFHLKFKGPLPSLDEVIQKYIEFAVNRNNGARDKTASEIGINRKTLYKRIKADDHVAHL